MKKPLTILALAAISCASLLIAEPSLAQLNSVDRGTDQNTDPLARPNAGDLNLFDMIHRANLGTLEWNPYQQREQIDSAASDFRARQQKAFEQRQQSNSNSESRNPGRTLLQEIRLP
jgi:hypothetical protein